MVTQLKLPGVKWASARPKEGESYLNGAQVGQSKSRHYYYFYYYFGYTYIWILVNYACSHLTAALGSGASGMTRAGPAKQ